MHSISPQQLSQEDLSGIRSAVLHDVLLGKLNSALVLPQTGAEPFQVVLLRACGANQQVNIDRTVRSLQSAGQAEYTVDHVCMGDDHVLLLWGAATLRKFDELIQPLQQENSAHIRSLGFPESLFLACSRVCQNPQELPHAYRDACQLMQQYFFCPPTQHLLRMEDLQDRSQQPRAINILMTEKYATQLLQCIQSFNRKLTASTLEELEALLLSGSDSPQSIRLFFVDLYLQIKEQMKHLYQSHTIPFYTNTHIVKTVMEAPRLRDITAFLAQRFDMCMSAIGASSQESVLDRILSYIQHNFASNITLESIAPLFGYNHSYLGKVFRKKTGVSFNEYVDRLRIEQAKTLLLETNAKVYSVSQQVGYKNVDYFHVKFRKYVYMSPVEFRKAHSSSPEP